MKDKAEPVSAHDLDWNSKDFIAVGGDCNKLFINKYNRQTKKISLLGAVEFELASKIRSLRFCPLDQDVIAVGMYNGTI